ncbi:hypothetical protein EVAR_11747_1 [Eumeta japonica]|uniref:Uncharacterized protein n=1 Tax=Eumeta variegata TaxID=151549 RepID=A0A4C1UPC3_EUMVA|nr:hypothetical protein EVAR_11747_1 [Eumeta japonica]
MGIGSGMGQRIENETRIEFERNCIASWTGTETGTELGSKTDVESGLQSNCTEAFTYTYLYAASEVIVGAAKTRPTFTADNLGVAGIDKVPIGYQYQFATDRACMNRITGRQRGTEAEWSPAPLSCGTAPTRQLFLRLSLRHLYVNIVSYFSQKRLLQ